MSYYLDIISKMIDSVCFGLVYSSSAFVCYDKTNKGILFQKRFFGKCTLYKIFVLSVWKLSTVVSTC